MSLPYFPLYPTDFEADTSHLTLAEDGAYNRLLRLCWMTPGGNLPADDAWIMRRMRATSDDDRAAVLSVLSEFFTVTNGRYSNARLARIFADTNEAHAKRVLSGSKGGKAKAAKSNDKGPSKARAMPKQPEPEPEPDTKRDTKVSLGGNAPDIFEDWWLTVPRKIAKGDAKRAFSKALKKTDSATIFAAMRAYAESRDGEDPRFTAHPATWLNAERWNDDLQKGSIANDKYRKSSNANAKSHAINAAVRLSEAQSDDWDTGSGGAPKLLAIPRR